MDVESAPTQWPDPFWATVRRRHPDVRIMLLPPAPPDEPPQDDSSTPLDPTPAELTPADIEGVRAETAALAAALWQRVGLSGQEPRDEIVPTGAPRRSRARVVYRAAEVGEPAASAAVVAVTAVLADVREAGPGRSGAVRRLRGRRGDHEVEITASHTHGTVVLAVSSSPFGSGA